MELLELFAKGELEAFETLFRQFQGEVYGWIIRIVRDPGVAEDLTVETFWRIYQARSRFDPARSLVPGPGESQLMPLSMISRSETLKNSK